ncbi:MAG: M23 family metallopeptidase [Gammaproteobacteria bacterium]|nr:M23 family metallopeptidase [Gammaproteobacteria bacterium]
MGRSRQLTLAVFAVAVVLTLAGLARSGAWADPSVRTWHFRLSMNDLVQPPPPYRPGVALAGTVPVRLADAGSGTSPKTTGSSLYSTYASSTALPASDIVRHKAKSAAAMSTAVAQVPADSRKSGAGQGNSKVLGQPVAMTSGEGGDYYVDQAIRSGESLTSLLGRHDISPAVIHRLSMLPRAGRHLRNLRLGSDIKLFFDSRHQLTGLKYQLDEERYIDIKADADEFHAKVKKYPVEFRRVYAEGKIESSLFYSGHRAGLTDKTITKFASIFSWDIDFARDLRPGDRFEILYENKYVNDRFVGSGNILRARLYNRSRWLDAIRYEQNGRGEYYSPLGVNLRRAFIRNPLDPSLISSHYSRKRMHPILKVNRPHTGVDYAAPTNTPIRATGFGTVTFRGTKGGYGKTVIISHGDRYQTLYAHMNRFVKSVRKGSRVSQGQVIGYVGSTGRSTGPHLHYEFRIKGKHTDPQKVKLPSAKPLRGEAKRRFTRQISPLLSDYTVRRDRYREQGDRSALVGL